MWVMRTVSEVLRPALVATTPSQGRLEAADDDRTHHNRDEYLDIKGLHPGPYARRMQQATRRAMVHRGRLPAPHGAVGIPQIEQIVTAACTTSRTRISPSLACQSMASRSRTPNQRGETFPYDGSRWDVARPGAPLGFDPVGCGSDVSNHSAADGEDGHRAAPRQSGLPVKSCSNLHQRHWMRRTPFSLDVSTRAAFGDRHRAPRWQCGALVTTRRAHPRAAGLTVARWSLWPALAMPIG